MQEQDEQLELVSGSIRVLKDMSGRIGDELDEQAVWVYTHKRDPAQRLDVVISPRYFI